jgi:hypothetical protein
MTTIMETPHTTTNAMAKPKPNNRPSRIFFNIPIPHVTPPTEPSFSACFVAAVLS